LKAAAVPGKTALLALSVVLIAAVLLLFFRQPLISRLFTRKLPHQSQRRLLLAALSFSLVFSVARTLAWANRLHVGPFHNIYIYGRHVHHLVWGILVRLTVGYGWLLDVGRASTPGSVLANRLMSLLYGSGAALTLDEFALWLNLEDVYWLPEGRASIDAVILFGAVLLAGIGGMPFFRALGCEALRAARRLRSLRPIGRRTQGPRKAEPKPHQRSKS
jgi:hypothetical protein